MRKESWIVFLVIGIICASAAPAVAREAQDIQTYPSCNYCGMDRLQFAHSRVLIEYDDGTGFGACSIHCAAVDLALHIDKTPRSIRVGDYIGKDLIDAEGAAWVLGGNRPGVMTRRAKWAFARKEDAEKFVKENGGVLATFDQVMKATYEDMYEDTKMIREKRKAKRSHKQGHES